MPLFDDSVIAPIPGVGTSPAEYAKYIERNVLLALRVGMPGEVVAWYPPVSAGNNSKPAMVDVQPHFIEVVGMNSRDELTTELQAAGWTAAEEYGTWVRKRKLPVLRNRPVVYPGPAGMLSRGPLKVGECGWLAFADRSLDQWIQIGGPIDPTFHQYHDITDAVFFPGLRYGKAAKSIDNSRFTIGPEDDSAGFDVDDATKDIALRTTGSSATIEAATEIVLGQLATLGVARLNDKVSPSAAMSAWAVVVQNAINAVLPGTFIPGVNDFATTVLNNFASISEASTKVKAE